MSSPAAVQKIGGDVAPQVSTKTAASAAAGGPTQPEGLSALRRTKLEEFLAESLERPVAHEAMLGATEAVLLKTLFEVDEAADEVLSKYADRVECFGAKMTAADTELRLARQIDSFSRLQRTLAAERRSGGSRKPR